MMHPSIMDSMTPLQGQKENGENKRGTARAGKANGRGRSTTPIGCGGCCTPTMQVLYCDHQGRRVGDNGDTDIDCVGDVRGQRAGHTPQEGHPELHAYRGELIKHNQREIRSPARDLQSVRVFRKRLKPAENGDIFIKEHGSGRESC